MEGWNGLIESTLDAVHVDPLNKEIRIELTCAWEDKTRKQIVAIGVDDFVLDEMRLSNVVDRVSCFNADDLHEIDSIAAKTLFFLLRGREPNPSDFEWPTLKEKLACIRDGTLSLLKIEPVYGAMVIVLAKDIKLQTMN